MIILEFAAARGGQTDASPADRNALGEFSATLWMVGRPRIPIAGLDLHSFLLRLIGKPDLLISLYKVDHFGGLLPVRESEGLLVRRASAAELMVRASRRCPQVPWPRTCDRPQQSLARHRD
jgi:hypothetical protein